MFRQTLQCAPRSFTLLLRRSFSFQKSDLLRVDWNEKDEESGEYEFAWLRDNCRCSRCVDASSGQKLFQRSVLLHPNPSTITKSADSDSLTIIWDDQHESTYHKKWLQQYNMSEKALKKRTLEQQGQLWTNRSLLSLPSISCDEILHSNQGLYKWLSHLENEGICLITESGREENQVKAVVEKVGPIRTTTYGPTWKVESVPQPENIAYTSLPLDLHSDILYYETPPGVQLLHCIKQAKKGAENFFADSFKIAEDFRKEHPAYFRTLCEIPITYQKEHDGVFLKYKRPLFEVGIRDELVGVYFSAPFEGPMENSNEVLRRFYPAYVAWHDYISKEEYRIEYKLNEGDIISFNNRRVLHGRNSFPSTERRLLVGTYFDLDELGNKLRTMKREAQNVQAGHGLKRMGNWNF